MEKNNVESKVIRIVEEILKEKATEEINEVKVDLKRVMKIPVQYNNYIGKYEFYQNDYGYLMYLFEYYKTDIDNINSASIININYGTTNSIPFNIEMRNYLIKIAIVRLCNKKGIEVAFDRLNNNDLDYCLGLLK